MRSFMLAAALSVVGLSTLPQQATAHTWGDCFDFDPVTKDCTAYGRGYPGRNDIDINTKYTYLFSGTPSSQLMCDPKLQGSPMYSTAFPMGEAVAGKTYKVSYEINGHQSFRDTVMKVLYFPGRELGEVNYNERSKAEVLGEWKFMDEARCDGWLDNSNCWGTYTLPATLPSSDRFQLVLFWEFNQNPAGQQYSTCFDLAIKGGSSQAASSSAATATPTVTDNRAAEMTPTVAATTTTNPMVEASPVTDIITTTGAVDYSGTTTTTTSGRKCRRRCTNCKRQVTL
ncbi:hypothetical protein H4R33_000697 [Dimargaris cristalligena]|nr:hypothetical protein H4R33_000697 [Dimargaris cristalligena]